MPRATSSQRVIPPKMLKKTARHLRVADDHLERVDDALRVAPAAQVAEVGRATAGERDHVDGRHRQPGAVPEHPDLAVELDVGDTLLARERLERIGRGRVAHRGDLRMAVERVVVDRELRVERPHVPVGRDDQRVDLAEHGVEPRVRLEELRHDRGDLLLLRRRPRHPRRRRAAAPATGWNPSSGSTWSRTSASGDVAATSSMSIPPCVVNMKSDFRAPRSNVSER